MKTIAVLVLFITPFVVPVKGGESATNTPPLSDQMQRAILRDQDLEEITNILKAGFDINTPIGCGTFNALDGAVEVRNAEMVKMLLDAGAKPKGRAFILAASCRNHDASLKMVELFLHAGIDVNYKDEQWFGTALHGACYQENYEVVKLLINQTGIELNNLNIDDKTPLMIAVEKGNHGGAVQLLLEKGVDPLLKNSEGKLASDFAREQVQLRNIVLTSIVEAETAARSKTNRISSEK